ncbi:TIGR03790 family protein [Duganella sp. CF402]|uniref:TIGR03790 family protein n=1 Tax=unclassified Duganella TaxID=2636909 RepID=UPI0008B190B6|nr:MULTISPECIES: TIGR03790 family protein [unclassified Duganella]RZT04595.1 uncharacterized protein (TIGR03790 family) [Duganella sp. BK701]SEM30861.1 TIGR03790 family protein [Duganella sp. CF402]
MANLLGCGIPAMAQMSAPPRSTLQAGQLGVVINDDDPLSVELGAYYVKARGVPAKNVAHVRIPDQPRKLDAGQFAALKQSIDEQLGADIQAVVMVWTAPYAVECNSITAAYTLGFNAEQCAKPCGPGKDSAYFNSTAARPSAAGVRLSMLLPAETLEQGKALVDRGILSSFRMPAASAYFLITSDAARSSRAPFFPQAMVLPKKKLAIKVLRTDSLENANDIVLYQTGLAKVPKLETLRFVPGALADHLTSFGGDLLGTNQMSSLRWLEAGATASYGTVSEPCNYWQKFPNGTVLLASYLNGATAIEAYWKSVKWPSQGLFIGEPLAAPYRN